MRFLFFLPIACLFTSCAYQGTIVQKQSRPHPLYHSLGIEGVYTFHLRDNASAVHSQMVTPDVFDEYAVGDYFNDQQPGGARGDAKSARTASNPGSNMTPMRIAMHQPTFSVTRPASVSTTPPLPRVAATTPTGTRKSVASTSSAKPSVKHVASHAQASAHPTAHKKLVAQHSKKSSAAKKRIASTSSKKSRHTAAKSTSRKPWKLTEPNGPAVDVSTAHTAGPTPIPAEGPEPQQPPLR